MSRGDVVSSVVELDRIAIDEVRNLSVWPECTVVGDSVLNFDSLLGKSLMLCAEEREE